MYYWNLGTPMVYPYLPGQGVYPGYGNASHTYRYGPPAQPGRFNPGRTVVSSRTAPVPPAYRPGLSGVSGQQTVGRVPAAEIPQISPAKLQELKERLRFDFLRDTPLRYLGYANEVVEAGEEVFKAFLGKTAGGKIYRGAYKLSDIYLGADVVDKGRRAYELAEGWPQHIRIENSLLEGLGAGIFQYFSSYKLPPMAVRYTRLGVQKLMDKIAYSTDKIPKIGKMRLFLPAFASIAIVPFIAHPIDKLVHRTMELTYWPFVNALFHRPMALRLVEESIFEHHMQANVIPVRTPVSADSRQR